ncbi:MAG: MATE family efflux transporter [Oscillospiraceae bacterium]|jgi:putative MATE family efflux protein|nr:MATE family efflux transporter [Oscillospiraceae bacterium]
MVHNNLSEGNVLKKLVLFSLPFLASNIVQSFYNVADMLIVGNFCGPEAMSGVNIGGQVTFILTNVIFGLCVGATVLIGQYIGANNLEAMKKTTATLFSMLLIAAVAITGLMLIFKGPVLRLIQTPPESYAESESYLTVTVIGIVFIFGYNALSAVLRGMGDSKRPFYFVLIACVTNVILDLIFVAVLNLAAFGAALATVISQAMSMILCILYMVRKGFHFDFKPSSFRIDKQQMGLIFKVGLPSCVQNGVTSISFLFITVIVNIIGGVSASAAVGAVGKFNSFVFMPTMAMSASISTMSAQNIGAGRLDRAVKCCKIGTVISVCISYAIFILVQIFPDKILLLFGNDAQMIENGVTYLRTFSFDYLLIPFIFCLNGLFTGGGHTFFTLINSMLSAVLLRVPVSYLFGSVLGWGLMGVGMGAPAASAGGLLLVIIFLISGRWKHNVAGIQPQAGEA